MNGWTVYTIIFIDICLRYIHLSYLKQDAVVEWFIYLTTEAARHLETPAIILLLTAPVKGLPRKITWLWCGWLTLDFIEQVYDKNAGAQLWELGLFTAGCLILIWLHWKRLNIGLRQK